MGLVPVREESRKCTFSISPPPLLSPPSTPPPHVRTSPGRLPRHGPEWHPDLRLPDSSTEKGPCARGLVSVSEIIICVLGSLTEKKIFLWWPCASLFLLIKVLSLDYSLFLNPELLSLCGDDSPWVRAVAAPHFRGGLGSIF